MLVLHIFSQGFETRGTPISAGLTAWSNLLDSVSHVGPLTTNPLEGRVLKNKQLEIARRRRKNNNNNNNNKGGRSRSRRRKKKNRQKVGKTRNCIIIGEAKFLGILASQKEQKQTRQKIYRGALSSPLYCTAERESYVGSTL